MLFMVWILCLIGSSFVMFLVSLVLDVLRSRMGAGLSGGLALAARLWGVQMPSRILQPLRCPRCKEPLSPGDPGTYAVRRAESTRCSRGAPRADLDWNKQPPSPSKPSAAKAAAIFLKASASCRS